MEGQLILLDTSVLIEYFRKTNKTNSLLHKLSHQYSEFHISVLTHFEILRGINEKQQKFWWDILKDIQINSYTPSMNYTALQIRNELKKKRKSISIEDLIIAATAVHYNRPLATLNESHFNLISTLSLVTPASLI
ncbi:MAG: type II toxin-antitoxin system VapC family toxin [Chitinophagaceae bacterium]|nr:type II toxin-antitoxin system VapC family toxin [Chitinophagaceae bacterium]